MIVARRKCSASGVYVDGTGTEMLNLKNLRDESGQVVIFTAVAMVVIIAFLGLAIDIGNMRASKRNLQTLADTAALAAALEIRQCGGTGTCAAMTTAAKNAVAESGQTVGAVITNCSGTAGTVLTVMVNNAPCALSTDTNKGNLNFAEVVVSQQIQTYFASIVGFNSVTVSARSEAMRANGPCIWALDKSGAGAISVPVALGVQSQCGVVDESSSAGALQCLVALGISAPSIKVTGGVQGLLCSSTPAPRTGVPVPTPADPLAYIPAPADTDPSCTAGYNSGTTFYGSKKQVNIIPILNQNVVFNPGVYCGGIALTAAVLSNVTFNPGVYIMKNGQGTLPGVLGLPGLPVAGLTTSGMVITISALSNITGQGVTFYNQGNAGGFSITASSPVGLILPLNNFNLIAPFSGTYGGILFFQAHGVTNTGTYLANLVQGSQIAGAIYEPDALVSYGVGVISNNYNILVAKDLQFTANVLSNFGNNYSELPSGSPINADIAKLVQ